MLGLFLIKEPSQGDDICVDILPANWWRRISIDATSSHGRVGGRVTARRSKERTEVLNRSREFRGKIGSPRMRQQKHKSLPKILGRILMPNLLMCVQLRQVPFPSSLTECLYLDNAVITHMASHDPILVFRVALVGRDKRSRVPSEQH